MRLSVQLQVLWSPPSPARQRTRIPCPHSRRPRETANGAVGGPATGSVHAPRSCRHTDGSIATALKCPQTICKTPLASREGRCILLGFSSCAHPPADSDDYSAVGPSAEAAGNSLRRACRGQLFSKVIVAEVFLAVSKGVPQERFATEYLARSAFCSANIAGFAATTKGLPARKHSYLSHSRGRHETAS